MSHRGSIGKLGSRECVVVCDVRKWRWLDSLGRDDLWAKTIEAIRNVYRAVKTKKKKGRHARHNRRSSLEDCRWTGGCVGFGILMLALKRMLAIHIRSHRTMGGRQER